MSSKLGCVAQAGCEDFVEFEPKLDLSAVQYNLSDLSSTVPPPCQALVSLADQHLEFLVPASSWSALSSLGDVSGGDSSLLQEAH